MSKIIIHNNSRLSDQVVIHLVRNVVLGGFISGPRQYCWLTRFESVTVNAKKTRGTTHTFEVRDI